MARRRKGGACIRAAKQGGDIVLTIGCGHTSQPQGSHLLIATVAAVATAMDADKVVESGEVASVLASPKPQHGQPNEVVQRRTE